MFPAGLYTLHPRDLQVTWLDPVFSRTFTQAAGSNTIFTNFTVPIGRALVLSSLHLEALPGATQAVVATSIDITDAEGINVRSRITGTEGPTTIVDIPQPFAPLVVPWGLNVQARAVFDASANPNRVTLSLCGLLIPIGNIAR